MCVLPSASGQLNLVLACDKTVLLYNPRNIVRYCRTTAETPSNQPPLLPCASITSPTINHVPQVSLFGFSPFPPSTHRDISKSVLLAVCPAAVYILYPTLSTRRPAVGCITSLAMHTYTGSNGKNSTTPRNIPPTYIRRQQSACITFES